MSRGSICVAVLAIGIIAWGLSVSAPAQSESTKNLHCPKGYSQVGSYCINSDGDVVKPQ
jgi:hypothetical protein